MRTKCPGCGKTTDFSCKNSRGKKHYVYRRYECRECGTRITTREYDERFFGGVKKTLDRIIDFLSKLDEEFGSVTRFAPDDEEKLKESVFSSGKSESES